MDIKITPQLLAESQAHQQIALYAIMNGSQPKWQGDGTVYGLDADGEMLIKPEHLPLLVAEGVSVSDGEFYVEMTYDEYESEVPSVFPECTYEDEEENKIPRVWSEYAPFSKRSIGGDTFLVRCVKVPYGETSGIGLSKEEFPIWYSRFTGRILTKLQGRLLLDSEKYKDNIGLIGALI